MKIIKKAPILLLLLLVVLAILPVLNGYFAEKEIRSFFRRSPLGEKAVRSYDKGYLKSYCSVEFDALDLLKGYLDENQREQFTGVLTSVVMRSSFEIYHCPSLKDRTFYCKGEGQTVLIAPGNIEKAVDLKASLGWDACVRASFVIPGGTLSNELLEALMPGLAVAESFACDVKDIKGSLTVPLSGKSTSFECQAVGAEMGEGGFSNFFLKGGSRIVSENVTAYALTGTLQEVSGGKISADSGFCVVSGTVSNQLHNTRLLMEAETNWDGEKLPMRVDFSLSNCHFGKFNEFRTNLASLKKAKKNGFNLGVISQVAGAFDSIKEFLRFGPAAGCRGEADMPEGKASFNFRCDTSKISFSNWREILRFNEKLEGGVDIIIPKAAVKEGGTVDRIMVKKGLPSGQGEKFFAKQAVESNDYYVIHQKLNEMFSLR